MSARPVARVLVVDDHDASRYGTSRVLKAAGFEILEAATGAEAIALSDHDIDLVVLDINLPDLDGFEVCRQLRSRRETADMPVLYLSATFTTSSDVEHGMRAGADSYLTHPADPVALIATVRALLFAHEAQTLRRAANERFKTLFDVAPTGMALLDPKLVVMDANPAFCAMLGRSRNELVSHSLAPLLDAADARRLAEAVTTAAPWRGVLELPRTEGVAADIEWTLTQDPGSDLLVAMITDVTERRLSETRQLRSLDSERAARAEAELSNQLKDQFLATLSHELRNPLGAILGWSAVLKNSPELSPSLRAASEAIDRNARVQSHLISDLLDFAGIRFGKMRLEVQLLDASSVVRAAVDTVSHQAQARGIELTVDAPASDTRVLGDEARLQQVVWNLLTNAIKFTPSGGLVHASGRVVDGTYEIAVADTGRGIVADFLPRLFDRFSQEDASKAKSFAGLGIGLSIVRHLVEQHEGTIEAESPGEGHGSTFRVRLPIATVPSTVARQKEGGPLSGIRVLVVEDGDDTRALIARLLTDAGAEVGEASHADQALARIEIDPPDVLVSDIGMARVDGYALMRTLRGGRFPASRLPAIALTAFVRDEDRAEALQAGFQVHLGKPVNASSLISAIVKVTAREG